MQPENQLGNPVPPAPQAPQQTPPPPVYQAAPQQQSFQEQVSQSLQQPTPPPAQPVQPQQSAPQISSQPIATASPVPQPQSVASPIAPEVLGSVAVADQVDGGYGYEPGDESAYDEEAVEIDLSEPVTWQAKEFIHQEKGTTWFIVFAVVIALFMAVAILLMRSWSFAVLLVVIAVVIVVLSRRPPRVMEYALSEDGLHIDSTLHKYEDFKSFGVVHDTNEFSIMLIPRRRFMPGITVYFPEEAGEDIVDVLGSRLPMRDLHLDAVDRVVRKLRL